MQAAFSQALVEGLGRVPGKSEGLGNGGAPGVKFITNPPACKNWLLAATQGIAKANAIIQGSTLNFGNLFLNIMHVAGPGLQYFTYEGHLYKFWYTGYDTKTGKYNQGSQYKNTIYVCTDGMSVLKNPDGTSEYLVVPSGSGGEVLVTNTPPKREFDKFYRSPAMLVHDAQEESSMETAFNVRGLGRAPVGDHAFNPVLCGLGVTATLKTTTITPTPTTTLPSLTDLTPIAVQGPLVLPSSASGPPKLHGRLFGPSSTTSTSPTPPIPSPAPVSPAPAVAPPSGYFGQYTPQSGAAQAPAQAAPVAATTIPMVAYVMLGVIGLGMLGGVAYLMLE